MIKVMIRGNWANYVGTDYCEALGIYNNLDEAWGDADTFAWDRFEPSDEDYDEGEYVGEGPDYYIEEYDPNVHDMHSVGGGSFEDEFSRM